MSHMTEECYTAHPWMLAAKWHGGVLVLRDVIGNPCRAITSQCVWLKLMSHFYWGRVRRQWFNFFFPFRRGRFILEKNSKGCLVCLFVTGGISFVFLPSSVRCVVCLFGAVGICACVCMHIQLIVQLLWNYGVVPWPLDINPQLQGSQCPQGSDSCLANFKGKIFTDFRIIIGCVDDHHLKLIVYFLLAWGLRFWHLLI